LPRSLFHVCRRTSSNAFTAQATTWNGLSRRRDNPFYGDLRIMPMWSTFGLVGGYAASLMSA
jgi:hypothetical protein